jgi:hypothetical protein
MGCTIVKALLDNEATDEPIEPIEPTEPTELEGEQIWLAGTIGRAKLLIHFDGFKLEVLNCGSCETLKLGVHAASLALAVVMGAYNAAAWFKRREQHLAVNAVLYAGLIALEHHHVAHHLALLRKPPEVQ